MIWLKLKTEKEFVRINANAIDYYLYDSVDDSRCARIWLQGRDRPFCVNETPEEIDRLISEAMAAQD